MDLISSVLAKIREKAQELGKNISDEQGFFRQGKFTPIQNIKEYFNPERNAGQNFWSTPVANYLGQVQQRLETSGGIRQFSLPHAMASGKLQTGIPPLDYLSKNIGAYAKNMWIEPALDIPSSVKQIVKPEQGQSRLAGAGRLGLNVLSAIPDPTEIPLAAFQAAKALAESKRQGESGKQTAENIMKAVTWERPVGLGTVFTSQPTLETAGNIAELPLLLMAGGLKAKNVKGLTKDVGRAVKEGKITAEEGQEILKAHRLRAKLKTRGVIVTAKESEFVDPVIKSMVRGDYLPKSNEQTYKWAANLVKNNFEEAERFVGKMPSSAETTAVASHLVKRYQEIGDFKKAEDLINEIAKKATQAGQFNQAFAKWKLLTPEGMQKYAQRVISEANEKMGIISKAVRKILGKETKIELTNEDYREINNWMKLAMREPNEEISGQYIRRAFEVINKKLPWGVSDILDEFRYNNMLSNPLTHLKNFTSNAWQAYVVRPLTLLAEGKPKEAVKYEVKAISAIPDAVENFTKTLKEGKQFRKMDVDELASIGLEKPRVLGRYNLPSQLMEATDSLFSTIIEAGEMARGKSPEEAYKTAQHFLFRGELRPEGQGWILNKIDDLTKQIYGLRKVGLGWVIPFIRTPMNVAKQWFEYSPFGFSTMIGAANKREQLAKALVGTSLSLVGLKLALEDRVTGAAPIDPLAKKLFYDSGKKPFSVRIGDVWVPAQSFGVFGFALVLPAIFKQKYEEDPASFDDETIDRGVRALAGLAEFWANQTFVRNLGDFIRLISGDTDYKWASYLTSIANQMKPMEGFMRYVAIVIDPVFRKPKTIGETLISDIPFLTKSLPFYETTVGEPAKRNITNYIAPYAMGFANPEYEDLYRRRMMKLKSNAEERILKREAEAGRIKEIGQKVVVPTKDGVKILDLSKITPQENETEFQKALRLKKAFSYVDDILDSDLPVEKQAEYLAKLGISPEDASYYNVARQSNDIKSIWVKDEISKYGDNRQEMLPVLAQMRKEVNGKILLTNGVIDDLVDEGILSSDEGSYLKKLKVDKDGNIKIKLTGRGKSAKIKVPQIKVQRFKFKTQTPKLQPIKIGGIRKANRGRILKVRSVKYK